MKCLFTTFVIVVVFLLGLWGFDRLCSYLFFFFVFAAEDVENVASTVVRFQCFGIFKARNLCWRGGGADSLGRQT